MAKKAKTKDRIIESALRLFHENSYGSVGLYDIAKDLDLEQGHVYYHFKNKKALAFAVIEFYTEFLKEKLKSYEEENRPFDSIVNYLEGTKHIENAYLLYGCPLTSLSTSLTNEVDEDVHKSIPFIYTIQIDWLQKMYQVSGLSKAEAKNEAIKLLSSLQGTIHLCHVLRDKKILRGFIKAEREKLRLAC